MGKNSRTTVRKMGAVAAGAALVAGGAAMMAIGPGVGGFEAAGASQVVRSTTSASAKIYACYSDSTGSLSYLNYPTVNKCARGGIRISWNSGWVTASAAPSRSGTRGSRC
jgi:hypothetical protein